jgi:hypothetical protein
MTCCTSSWSFRNSARIEVLKILLHLINVIKRSKAKINLKKVHLLGVKQRYKLMQLSSWCISKVHIKKPAPLIGTGLLLLIYFETLCLEFSILLCQSSMITLT